MKKHEFTTINPEDFNVKIIKCVNCNFIANVQFWLSSTKAICISSDCVTDLTCDEYLIKNLLE